MFPLPRQVNSEAVSSDLSWMFSERSEERSNCQNIAVFGSGGTIASIGYWLGKAAASAD